MEINTKEMRNGKWSCYATITGYDHQVFGDTPNDARLKMLKKLTPSQLINSNWTEPKPYIRFPVLDKPPVTYARNRIDNL